MEFVRIRRALISVSDKTGIVEFSRQLEQFGVDIISTGGTLMALRGAGINAKSVSDITGFPEILDGRVKTLHPNIHAGILAVTENELHRRQLEEHHVAPIDLVVVNLYPFEQTIAKKETSLDEALEQIDIGGPSMVRAAAKNYKETVVLVKPAQYGMIIKEMMEREGGVSSSTRFLLAKEAFMHTSHYDTAIAQYLLNLNGHTAQGILPEKFSLNFPKTFNLRYGENPHQSASFYGEWEKFFEKLHGKELSYNNIIDIHAAAELTEEFSQPTAVIIKHTNPCGAASASTLVEAYRNAFLTDTKSAYGGIVCVNRPLDIETAIELDKIFTEVVIAPDFPPDVLTLLKKKKDRRLIRQRMPVATVERFDIKSIAGGVLVQTPDRCISELDNLKVVTKRLPTEKELTALKFAWRIAKHVKSNAIVYTQENRTIGVGAGQMSRFDSSRIAVMKAQEGNLPLKGTVIASDAFFPFADALLEAIKVGSTAVIQPGGSIRDDEVIQAADENEVAMVFTGIRHFKH
ncbi:MAG: bifunctional phosphoribosylaminoimidazolecarboxamide formyltransferase/IMP cyclohydrolase [Bacteroidota bacterium]